MRWAALVASVALVIGCGTGSIAGSNPFNHGAVPSTPDVLGCVRSSSLSPFPGPGQDAGYPGAHIGSLWWVLARADTQLVVPDFTERTPTKWPIELSAPLLTSASLVGQNCATGETLRFCYHPGCQHEVPTLGAGNFGVVALKTGGDSPAEIPPSPSGIADFSYTGDLLFWEPGLYRVTGRQNGQSLGSIVFGVPSK